jgi:hypothetical protein
MENNELWLYPEDLNNSNIVVNFYNDIENSGFNVYTLPENWKDIVTTNKGIDGKPSILDIMTLIS